MATNSWRSMTKVLSGKVVLNHVICWVLFITYELTIVFLAVGKLENPEIYIVYYLINISYFYLYIELINITFNGRKIKYVQGLLRYLGLLIIYLLVKSMADYLLDDHHPQINNAAVFIQGFFPRNITRAAYFTLFGTFYWSASHISFFRKQTTAAEKQQLVVQKEKAELETLLTKSRNAYLQQQINPHMLFNALNFVYGSAQKYSEEAANCIWLLAEIMRFSLEETGPDGKIVLERETEQIKNLLAINRYRYNEPLHIHVEMEGDFSRLTIIPLILLTLTENIFKHGNLVTETQPATLRIQADENGRLVFYSRNLKKSKSEYRRSKQIGLQNVRIRLDSIYPGKYSLDIVEPGEFYELTLALNL